MKTILTSVLATLILSNGTILASGYEITKVIEVGPGGGAIVGTVKWSPNGTMLAYFHKYALYVSDAMGTSREVIQLDLPPHRYEWLSPDEIIVHLKQYRSGLSDTNALVLVDLKTSHTVLLEQYLRGPAGTQPNGIPNSFRGPLLTVERIPYYRTNVIKRPNSGPEGTKFPESSYVDGNSAAAPSQSHIVSWGEDGLYLIKGDLTDSTRIAPKPYLNLILPPAISADLSRYAQGGTMYRFSDSSFILLDTIPKEFPPKTTFA